MRIEDTYLPYDPYWTVEVSEGEWSSSYIYSAEPKVLSGGALSCCDSEADTDPIGPVDPYRPAIWGPSVWAVARRATLHEIGVAVRSSITRESPGPFADDPRGATSFHLEVFDRLPASLRVVARLKTEYLNDLSSAEEQDSLWAEDAPWWAN